MATLNHLEHDDVEGCKSLPGLSGTTANQTARLVDASHEQAEHAKTQVMLAQVLERLDSTPAYHPAQETVVRSDDWFTRLTSGKPGGFLSLLSNIISVWPFCLSLLLVVLQALPLLPHSTTSLSGVIPVLVTTAAMFVAVAVCCLLPGKQRKMRLLYGVAAIYSAVSVTLLLWLCTAFLHQDNIVSGVCLTITLGGTYKTARWMLKQMREMREMMRARIAKDLQTQSA